MRHRWLSITLLLLAASPLSAQVGGPGRDTTGIGLRIPDREIATRPLRLGFRSIAPPFALESADPFAPHGVYAAPGAAGRFSFSRFVDWTAAWETALRAREAAEPWRRWLGPSPPAREKAAGDAPGAAVAVPDLIPEALQDVVDLGMRVSGRGELGGAWTRFEPCDPTLQLNCNPGIIPLLKPDVQFGVVVEGTISDRIHVDVDYDQRREFDAANNINIYYQGLEGEVLQRIELGDVSIRLPASRYLTAGIPGGNFGFKAAGQIGALDLQAVWAQQKGDVATREFRLGGARGPEGLVQDARVALDDADYVKGQFFFLVDPDSLAGAPHVDILALRAADAPASLRPARGGEIQLYRDERPSFVNPEQQAQLGYFLAEGVAADGVLRHRGQFRRLIPGEDYIVHPSGLWVMLRSPLRNDEALAAAFATEAGGAVGTPDAERAPPGSPPTLFLLRGPATIHQPTQPTWRFEMHQVYRLDSSAGVDPASVDLRVSLGELAAGATYKEVAGGPLSLLRLFGMDEDAPAERLDEAQLFQPARGGYATGPGDARFAGTFAVFPTLRPFAEPPPVPSAGLSAADAAVALGADANPAIYESPDPVDRDGSARFRLNFEYLVELDGVVSTFDLGAFGIREGSEEITVDGRPLQRGIDYTIDYDIGQVTLSDPQGLFGANPDAEIRATWEQKALFQIAPRTLFGLNAHYPFGAAGEINVVGLYQAEKSLVNRPVLGLEPSATFLGGASGAFDLGAGWLDNALSVLPGADDTTLSRIRVSGELAVSMPNPNRRGDTYLDDFEAGDEFPLGLDRRLWRLGSRPEDIAGAEAVMPVPLDVVTAAPLVWQHDLLDGSGRVVGPRLAREIDRQINVAGAQRTEPVLYLTLGDATTPATQRRWRSVTTVLETTGRDMSRSEYLEFYAAAPPGQDFALVFDIGTVSEDAYYFDAAGATEGEYPGGRRWGLGLLDAEARLAEREIWSTAADTLGLWNQPCRAEPGRQSYAPGDPRANCTRGNGLVDTEDLDGNGILDAADGAYFRYVVRLDGSSPYLVRDRSGTGTEYSLYRIPLRGPNAIAVNGATDGTWRFIKHLRMTVAGLPGGPGAPDLSLARVRIIGSRWTKRDVHGILADLVGDLPGTGAATADFRVGPVSRITDGAVYSPPPGVGDELQDPTNVYGSTGVEFNEKSLRLAYDALEPGDRAEAYFRFPQQPRNLLSYRELRLWALPRAGVWGSGAGERLVVSVGTDPRNRYLYQTALRPAVTGGEARPEDWLPEVVIDFARWFDLKAQAEQALVSGAVPPGEPVVVWSADSAYAVVLEDRARAPNLAAVRELVFAVYNAGGAPATGEVWVDELRLGGANRDVGLAGHWDLDLRAGDLAMANLSYANRGALFRQMDRDPSYQAATELSAGGTVQLGRLAPAGWALDVPVTVVHTRSGMDPTFLERSDVRADRLDGLRETGAARTRVGVSLRRAAPVESPWVGWLVEGTQLRFGFQTASVGAITSRDEARGYDGGVSYARRPEPRAFDATPGLVEGLLRALVPGAIEETELFRRLTAARVRWNPEELSFSTTYLHHRSRSYRYATILSGPDDAMVRPIESAREGLEASARIGFRPLDALTAGLTISSSRDLLPPEHAAVGVRQRQAIAAARDHLAGVDLGWEANRTLGSHLDFRPVITPWLRPSLGFDARFRTDRSPSYYEVRVEGDDTTAVLQRRFHGDRLWTRSLLVDPEGLTRSIAGGSGDDAGIVARLVEALGRGLQPINLSWSDGVGSRFERETLDPGLGYQLGLGGFDAFRVIAGDTAASANLRGSFRARGGLRLPARLGLDIGYAESESESLDLGGGRRAYDDRTWPDLRLAWTDLPVPGGLRGAIVYVTASVGYQRTTRESWFGAGAGERRGNEEMSIPILLSIALGNGLSGSYTGTLDYGSASDPTGSTERDGTQHAIEIAGSFVAPAMLRDRLPAPIRASLRYAEQAQRQCRVQPDGATVDRCIPFVDTINRQLSLMLDTVIAQLNVGFQMSYNDRQSYVGLNSGSSQFQLGLFGEFNFEAGTFARGAQ